jgi:hypothetical protein
MSMDIRYPPNALYKIELWKPNMCIHLYHFWPPLDDEGKKMVRNSFRNRIPSMRQFDVLLGRPIYFRLVGRDCFFGIFMFPSCFQWFPMMVPTCSSSSQCTLKIIFTPFSSSQCVPQDVPNSITLYPIIFARKWSITVELWAKENLYTSIAQCFPKTIVIGY